MKSPKFEYWPRRHLDDANPAALADIDESDCRPIIDWRDPDWLDRSAYNHLEDKKTTPKAWAWEFWRRSDLVRLNWSEGIGKVDPTGPMPNDWMTKRLQDPIIRSIEVDITLPLEAQFKTALKNLKKELALHADEERHPPRLRPSNYVTYLRVMDAASARAPIEQVAERLSTLKRAYSTEEIYGLWEKARELSRYGVVWLAYKPHTRHSRKGKKIK